jgi:RNA polymerase sigma factor (sigma-70 family)
VTDAREPQDSPVDDRSSRLAAWFQRWRRPVRHWLSDRSAVPAAELDDLAQEVFLRLLRYSDDIAIENPQGYLFRIAANVANEWRERARRKRPHDDSWLEDLQIATSEEPENALARERVQDQVRKAVMRLPPRQREVLALHVSDGLTYQEIAARLGLTPRMVLRDLTRAYSRLRVQLDLDDLSELEK